MLDMVSKIVFCSADVIGNDAPYIFSFTSVIVFITFMIARAVLGSTHPFQYFISSLTISITAGIGLVALYFVVMTLGTLVIGVSGYLTSLLPFVKRNRFLFGVVTVILIVIIIELLNAACNCIFNKFIYKNIERKGDL